MAAASAPLRWIQAWLGHSDYRTTTLYADYVPDLSRAAYWAARAFDNASPDQAGHLDMGRHGQPPESHTHLTGYNSKTRRKPKSTRD
jgi:hypothetical protein